jgi:hypothetical protein
MSFKSQFTNFLGVAEPTFSLQVYESDSQDGPWMKSETSNNDSGIFLINCKQYIKIELNIFFENEEEIQNFGLLLFIDVLIHDLSVPVISDSARSILSNFPTWSALYEDSIEPATPELATPNSIGGAFINALVGEHLDDFESHLDLNSLNSFISTADEDIIDWIYITYGVPTASISINGDSVPLSRCGSIDDLYSNKKTDYIYYHNIADNQIITLRKFENFEIDGALYDQDPILYFNIFDEFGTRVGLKRLFLENNDNYKKRILDTYRNIPSVDLEGFKRTLRRELDIWRAYGATPDSDYLGATPEVMEILDIEGSVPYVAFNLTPEKKLFNFVKLLNETYPSNFGYANWDEGMWDVAGLNYEGINTIPFIYDTEKATVEYFQPGVGDMDDLFVFVENDLSSTVSFSGYFKADGLKVESYQDIYAPIKIVYDYFGSYSKNNVPNPDVDNPSASNLLSNGGVNLVYELYLKSHNQYATPSVFYKNFSYEDRQDFIVKNFYSQNSSSSPEYNLIRVFNSDGFSDPSIGFKEKTYEYDYINQSATPVNQSIDIKNIDTVKLIANAKWNQNTQQYQNVTNASYRSAFNEHSSGYQVNPSFGQEMSIATPNINSINANFKIGSTVYGVKNIEGYTPVISDTIYVNSDNDISLEDDPIIILDELKDTLVYPINTTAEYLYIVNKKIYPQPIYGQEATITEALDFEHGGYAQDPYQSGLEFFVPSSPNIVLKTYSSYDGSGNSIESNYFEAATVSYYANVNSVRVTTDLSSTPYYPFKKPIYSNIEEDELKSTPMIFGYLDNEGNAFNSNERIENSGKSPDQKEINNFVGKYNLSNLSFGASAQDIVDGKIIITHINPVADNEKVSLSSSKSLVGSNYFSPDTIIDLIYESIDYLNNELVVNYSPISVDAKPLSSIAKITLNSSANEPSVKSGWLYLPEEDYYVYAKPIVDIYEGQLFELELSQYPMQGAPILVESYGQGSTINYSETFFHDSSTPGNITFYNEEVLLGSEDLSLYLSYYNISDISIEDSFIGKVLVQSPLNPEFWIWVFVDENGNYILDMQDTNEYYIATLDMIQSGSDFYYLYLNKFQILNATTQESQIVPGREYTIRYKVNNSFYAERNDKKIYFSSTPNVSSVYNVTYESSEFLSSTPSGLSINTIENPLDQGYIYVSDEEYDFGSASIWISPQKISKDEEDLIYLSIVSSDINGNPKPNQTFRIYGNYLIADDEYITTNNNGFAKTIIRYIGSTDSVESLLNVTGISSSNNNAHPNSSSESFHEEYNILLVENKVTGYTLKSAADKIKIRANSKDTIRINGFIRDGNTPPSSTPVIYWRKARTAYEALNEVDYSTGSSTPGSSGISGSVVADKYGNFSIGPFKAQSRMDPGLWFVAVESELSSTPSANPVTIYGDIAYWFENYDNIHYSDESLPLPRFYTSAPLTGDEIISTPGFTYNYYDSNKDATPSATPELNWIPPKWFQISRYDQYQMGLFGSTPNVISVYSELYPDYEDN